MRSLMTKLVLAFLLTSVASVALASIIIRQFVTSEFNDYVLQQQRDSFVANVRTYYETHGSLTGVESWLRSSRAAPGADPNNPAQTHIPVQTPAQGSDSASASNNPPPAQRPYLALVQFGLVDAAGVVILPFEGHARGTATRPDEIARGTSITTIKSDGRIIATVITTGPASFRSLAEERYLARTDLALLLAAVVMIGVALVLGVFLARLITRPVRELTAAAGKIAAGDLEQRVPVRSHDELGMLAAQFNDMSANLGRATQLRRQMTADIAHDLRTPLTVISGYMEALRDQVLKPTAQRFAMINDEVQLLRHLVEDLHTLSLADAGELHLDRRPVTPQLLLERVANAYQHAAQQQGVALHVCVDDATHLPDICVDVEHMIRALGNLLSNALHYTDAGGQVTLLARAASAQVQLTVSDTGAGIAPEHLPNIFERSYRADASRQQASGGSGLGLAIVKSIVEAHGGQVKAESTVGQGTSMTIMLPIC